VSRHRSSAVVCLVPGRHPDIGPCAFTRPLTVPELTVKLVTPQPAVPATAEPAARWRKAGCAIHSRTVVCGYTNDLAALKDVAASRVPFGITRCSRSELTPRTTSTALIRKSFQRQLSL
jgi:hypothetical protein